MAVRLVDSGVLELRAPSVVRAPAATPMPAPKPVVVLAAAPSPAPPSITCPEGTARAPSPERLCMAHHEVTVSAYAECVLAGECEAPRARAELPRAAMTPELEAMLKEALEGFTATFA